MKNAQVRKAGAQQKEINRFERECRRRKAEPVIVTEDHRNVPTVGLAVSRRDAFAMVNGRIKKVPLSESVSLYGRILAADVSSSYDRGLSTWLDLLRSRLS